MPDHFPLMVPAARAAAAPGEVRSPLDQSLIATLDQVDLDGAQQALATAERLFRNRDAWLSPARRIEILRRAADLMQPRRDRLALEAAREGGKPLIDSLVEADRAVDSIRLCVEHLRAQAGEEIPMGRTASSGGRLAFTQLEPIGPVLAFSAFNHPLNLIAHQVGPAVAAGCPVVVKPAKATPLSCFRLVQILREAGLPDGVVPAAGDRRSRRGQPDRRRSAGGLLHVHRQRRGRLAAAAAVGPRHPLLAGTWRRGAGDRGGRRRSRLCRAAVGQGRILSCRAGLRFRAADLCRSADRPNAGHADRRGRRGAEGGDPTLLETEVGPLIRQGEVTRVDQWVQEAVQAGAGLLCGGRALPNNCYAPTVLFDPPDEHAGDAARGFWTGGLRVAV